MKEINEHRQNRALVMMYVFIGSATNVIISNKFTIM